VELFQFETYNYIKFINNIKDKFSLNEDQEHPLYNYKIIPQKLELE
jgi:hypothetical protein